MFEGDFTRVTNTMAPELAKTHVVLWDLGPAKPVPPKRPATPKGKEGDPEFDLAMIEFKQQLEDYDAELRAHKKAKLEYASWQEKVAGAVELRMFSCDAHDALQRDPKRYCVSASTRGHEHLPNRGLPEGVKPGRMQEENVRREQEGQAEFLALRAADPVFGQEMTR